jgi:hypothetical protein
MLTSIALLRGCGTVIQEGDIRKKFLSLFKEKGYLIESIGEITRGSPSCVSMGDPDIEPRHPNSENNTPTSV